MKKSIFLFFAAILCAIGMNAETWTVAGDKEIVNGTTAWKQDETKNDLTNVSGTKWGLLVENKTLSKKSYYFKITKDHAWTTAYPSSNYNFAIGAAGTYNIIYRFNTSGNSVGADYFKTWTVAGSGAVLTDDWKPDATANDMTRNGNTFEYVLTKKDVKLEKGTTYECKVCKDHAWTKAYPGSNHQFSVATTGYYDVTFKFNVATETVDVTTTLINCKVTTSANPTEGGSVTATKEYAKGSSVTLTATPAEGYEFVNWTKEGTVVSTSETYSFTVLEDVSLVANFKVPVPDVVKYQVTVSANDNTMGNVTGGGEYEEGVTALLTATPNGGYQFKNWTVAGAEVSTANPYTFTVNEDVTVTANFEETPKVTVYAINSANWDEIAVHHWPEGGAGTEWPGDLMINTGEKAPNGFDVYTATFTGEHTSCIFNNNGNGSQTGDLTVEDGHYYDLKTNKWYASLAEVPTPDPLATDVFLVGSMNAWSTTTDEFKKATEDATTASVTLTLDGSKDYTFKVVREGAWTSRKDQDDNMTITETIEGLQFSSDSGKDCKMKTNLAGPYIFTWEISTSKLSITYPTEEVIITYTYTIAGVEALTGSDWNPADNNNDMTDDDGDGIYTLIKEDVTLAANTSYGYKVARDHDWNDGQYPASGQPNESLSVAEDGLYKVVFTYDPTQQKLNATATKTGEATIIHTVQLAGTMNSWAAEDFTVNGTSATLTKSLNAGVYEFKIVENGNYCGNDGIMTRPNSTDWKFDGSGNAKLFADIAGIYTFTWNLENDELSVTHPNLEDNYPTIAIKGTMNEWKDDANVSSSVAEGKTSIDITLEEQKTYEFKVRVGATDLGNGGTMDKGNCSGWTFNPNDGSNAKITTYAAGTYTFVWEHATQKLSVTYPTGELTTLPKIYLAGAMLGNDNWEAGKQEFTADAEKKTATYTYNFTERDKTYEFKIISNEAWMGNNGKMKRGNSEGWTFNGNDGNAEIYMDIPGNYIFTWEYATNKLTVTYPELPKVALRGTMCGWDEATEIELQTMDDQAHAYVKVNLEANTYEFKIFEGDSWLSNNDAGTMNKSNNANWPFTTTQNNNTKVKIETAGNYYFIWNYAAQKLTVTYPVTIDEDAADNSKYSGYNSKIADVIVNRAFVNTYWQTITLPFSMNAAQINAMFGANTQVAKLASSEVQSKNNDDFVLNFDFVNTIDAGTPYLIKPANNVAEGAKVEGVVINTNTTNITTDDAWMIAVLDKKTHSNAKDYWLAENGYLYPFNNTEIKALRAYFYFPNISTSSPVRARVAFNENVETEVENITAPEIKAIKVIQNGQLIIIRDGVKYNVQGQVIR